jgi:CO/xanthine dehydrogenase FAD-binding subunit
MSVTDELLATPASDSYAAPTQLGEALAALAEGDRTVLAGGTDFYPARVGRPLTEAVVDITGVAELRGISQTDNSWRIGALTTWADVVGADLPPAFRGLMLAAREVGGVQIQNAGTVGGNLCNASPAADGVPPLLTLDASVELASVGGTRQLPLEEFLVGYRQTALRPDELLTSVLVPREHDQAMSHFVKLGSRRYLVISIVMAAALIGSDGDGVITDARIAIGSCSPVAQRARQLEADLVGRSTADDLSAAVTPDHLAMLSPIDDARAPASYRMDAALTMVRRALNGCRGSAT